MKKEILEALTTRFPGVSTAILSMIADKMAKSPPYFMRDNEKYIRPLTITPQARAVADEAQKVR